MSNTMLKLNDIICENKTNIDEREVKLNEEYHQLIKNDKQLNIASEYIYSELIDDLILSCAFEAHYAAKKLHTEKELQENDSIGSSSNDQEMTNNETEQSSSNGDNKNKKKIVYGKCSNCQKVVAVTKFASHLEHCFGIGRKVRLRKRRDD